MKINKNEIQNAKQYDLLTFLRVYNPRELIKESRNSYCIRSHSSLKISTTNNLWYQFSTGKGGRSALDYLIKIEGFQFVEAVKTVNQYCSNCVIEENFEQKYSKAKTPSNILNPPKIDSDIDYVRTYLKKRGINDNVIDYCWNKGLLKQDSKCKNAMFCGYDYESNLRYISMRGTAANSQFKGIAKGSDKQYTFRLEPEDCEGINVVHVFEAVIDLLSYATLMDMQGEDYHRCVMLSLDGVSAQYNQLPKTLGNLLYYYSNITDIVLHFDNDMTGKSAAEFLAGMLSEKYHVEIEFPVVGKDVNDELIWRMNNHINKQ